MIIVAGPGTGKTKTLTAKVVHILAQGLARPDEVLALTFTNKAAAELRRRVAEAQDSAPPLITTFHGLGYQILGSEQALISEAERLELIRSLVKSQAELAGYKGLGLRELSLFITRHKNSLDDDLPPLVQRYNEALRSRELRDYDDLLGQAYQLLRQDELVRRAWQQRCRYLLIDEFQDTNELQYELVKQLAASGNLTVIGDPRQSIYGFRGARAEIFDHFRADFPQHRAVNLTQNYRSGRRILELAQVVFPEAPQLVPQTDEPGRVRLVETLNEYTEADWVVRQIEQALGGTDLLQAGRAGHEPPAARRFRDFAVIYRTHRASQTLRRKFAASGIPYQVVGDDSPYARPEIKRIIAALEYVYDPADEQLTVLAEALGQTSDEVRATFESVVAQCFGMNINQLVEQCLSLTNLTDVLSKDNEVAQDLRQFANGLMQFAEVGLAAALEYLRELTSHDFYDARADLVTLLTIHTAKGLEFPFVFVCGLEEGLIPFRRPGAEPNDAEEQRLFYVAVTRAKTDLALTHARERGGQAAQPSRFHAMATDGGAERMVDGDLAKSLRRREQWRQQHRQTSLF
jgi:ATP-dependent DNA helicase UvrD/PcrA